MSNPALPGDFYYAVSPAQRDRLLLQGWVDDPEPSFIPMAGWGMTPGDLEDRPEASERVSGTAWFARDDRGGTLYVVDDEADEWIEAAPSVGTVTRVVERWVDPYDHGAVGDGVADDSDAIQAAVDAACTGGGAVVLRGTYRTTETTQWDYTKGHLKVEAATRGAGLSYEGAGWMWNLDMDAGAAGLPTVEFVGGHYHRTDTALGAFNCLDVRGGVWDHVEIEGDDDTGTAIRLANEGRWSERNEIDSCSIRYFQHAVHLDCTEETDVTHKAIASGVATLTIGSHPFGVGDRVIVELDTPDADYDSTNAQITAVTSTTISYATIGANEATTAATGTVYAKGSFARTVVRNLQLHGGAVGYAAIEMHPKSGPYDSLFDVRGNVTGGATVFGLTNGAMGGSVIDGIGVEVMSSGTVYLVRPAPAPTGRRPVLRCSPRLTANEHDTTGVTLYEGSTPANSPWYQADHYGGIYAPDGYIESELGVVLRISATHPALSDWSPGSNPPQGTLLLRDDNGGATGIYELACRTNNNIRTAGLLPFRQFASSTQPTAGTGSLGDICWNTSPTAGGVSHWRRITAGGAWQPVLCEP